MKLGAALTDGAEMLWRQVHPSFVQDGRVTSQAFRATPKDKGLLSVTQGGKCTAEHAFNEYISRPGCTSVGVLAVTVDECKASELNVLEAPLSTRDQEDPDAVDDDAHAVVDCRNLTLGNAKKCSQRLQHAASLRGFVHKPNQ